MKKLEYQKGILGCGTCLELYFGGLRKGLLPVGQREILEGTEECCSRVQVGMRLPTPGRGRSWLWCGEPEVNGDGG